MHFFFMSYSVSPHDLTHNSTIYKVNDLSIDFNDYDSYVFSLFAACSLL